MVRVNKEVKLMAQNDVKNILEQQKTLADQMRRHQQQAAQDAYAQGQRSLSQQLRQQRRTMQENRENLAQQSHLAQRNIQQGATSRGLGSSGLRNLASLQAQTAQGDALRRLAGDDAQIQREALDTRVALSEQLSQQMSGSEINYLQALLETDRFGLERGDIDRDTLLQLIEMSQVDGADSDLLDKMARIALGDSYKDLMSHLMSDQGGDESGSTNPFDDLIGSDEYGDKVFNAGEVSKGAEVLNYINPMAWGGSLGALIGDWFRESDDKNKAGYVSTGKMTGAAAGRSWYYLDGERVQLDRDQALQRFSTMFQNKQNVINGKIKLKLNNFGDLRFIADGKTYTTYNKAENALKP